MTDFFIDPAYKKGLEQLGLNSIDDVFNFQSGKNLVKNNLAPHRGRLEFQIDSPSTTLFLKRYNRPPIFAQLKNWLATKKRITFAYAEFESAKNLSAMGVNTPKMVACGQNQGLLLENRSFIIIEKINEGESLEKRLPDCFNNPATADNSKTRREFIEQLALFIKIFHQTGYRHRDLYLCHIFQTRAGDFYLIDLARAFRPVIFDEFYRVKDLAQLHYSAPAVCFSKTDRLRFLRTYLGRQKLLASDKTLMRRISKKADQMASHDIKHGRPVPFRA